VKIELVGFCEPVECMVDGAGTARTWMSSRAPVVDLCVGPLGLEIRSGDDLTIVPMGNVRYMRVARAPAPVEEQPVKQEHRQAKPRR